MKTTNNITFIDEEIDPTNTGHTEALDINLKCKEYMVAKILIDNGYTLKVLQMIILEQLSIDKSLTKPS